MSIIHSKFLVHWTGKDFHSPETILDDNIRKQYIDRLTDILTNGFFMQKNEAVTERIYTPEGEWIQSAISRTCFTEIKLSQAEKHAKSYGRLGIGVDREYVISRYGNPVFYITNGDHSNICACARKVLKYLEQQKRDDIITEFAIIQTYFKKMGEKNSEILQYYDESEWRITHLTRLERTGALIPQNEKEYKYRIKLSKEDVKTIVFPDEETKTLALNNQDIRNRIDNPICVTVEDCKNF